MPHPSRLILYWKQAPASGSSCIGKDCPLTWGVCRQDLRNAIPVGSIVLFFSFTPVEDEVLYRLCAVATVETKLDHRAANLKPQLKRHPYINALIRADGRRWLYDETD